MANCVNEIKFKILFAAVIRRQLWFCLGDLFHVGQLVLFLKVCERRTFVLLMCIEVKTNVLCINENIQFVVQIVPTRVL